MTQTQHSRVFWLIAAALAILHADFFNHGRLGPLLFGWLPWDLTYHILWVAAASALVFYMTHKIWRSPE